MSGFFGTLGLSTGLSAKTPATPIQIPESKLNASKRERTEGNNPQMERQPPISSSPSVLSGANPRFLKNFLGKESFCIYKISRSPESDPSSENINLEVEFTGLKNSEEQRLRKYIQSKAQRGSKSAIGILPGDSSLTQNNTICYHSLISVPFEKKTSEMIVCLTCEVNNDEGFTLFSNDLESFVEEIGKLLQKKKSKDNSEYLKTTLSSWYSYTVEYIYRCLDIVKGEFDVVFYSALVDHEFFIKKTDYNQSFIDDMWKFIRALRLKPNPKTLTVVEDESEIPEGAITIELDNQYTFHIRGAHLATNSFCQQTKVELQKLSTRDPLLLRHFVENHKYQVLQEFLHLKKQIDHSKLNNYSLYKAYKMLKTSANQQVLLILLTGQDSAADANLSQAINVITDFLQIPPEKANSNQN